MLMFEVWSVGHKPFEELDNSEVSHMTLARMHTLFRDNGFVCNWGRIIIRNAQWGVCMMTLR